MIEKIYKDKKKAERAEQEFNRIFKDKEIPSNIPEIKIQEQEVDILGLLVKAKLCSSKSEAKRLISQKGIKINGILETDWQKKIRIEKGTLIQAGRRKFIKLS